MKKQKLKNLSLNKSKVSNLMNGQIVGGNGILSYRDWTCPYGGTSENNCGGTIEDTIVATCAQGCTVATLELSYCNDGVPDGCQSVQACA